MSEERRTLSLGNVAERAREGETAAAAWKISPARAAQLKDRARDQRRNPTEAQAILWERLKDKQCGFTFTREVVVGSTIADFACKTRWLVVELGGTDGAEATLAALSDRKLQDVGVRVMRFAEARVIEETDAVVAEIKAELQKPFEKPGNARRPAPRRAGPPRQRTGTRAYRN